MITGSEFRHFLYNLYHSIKKSYEIEECMLFVQMLKSFLLQLEHICILKMGLS
jgi:hypothetical protein